MAVWSSNQVSDTDRYVANAAPLISEPAIQGALTDKISNQIDARLQLQKRANEAAALLSQKGLTRVGDLLHAFSGQLAGAVQGFIHTEVGKILASPQVARLWVQVNRVVHTELVKALSGQGGGAISISNGQVTLDLAPFNDVVKKDLSANGLTLVNQIPPIHPTFPLFSAKKLVQAQTVYRLVNAVGLWLPIIALVLIGLGSTSRAGTGAPSSGRVSASRPPCSSWPPRWRYSGPSISTACRTMCSRLMTLPPLSTLLSGS